MGLKTVGECWNNIHTKGKARLTSMAWSGLVSEYLCQYYMKTLSLTRPYCDSAKSAHSVVRCVDPCGWMYLGDIDACAYASRHVHHRCIYFVCVCVPRYLVAFR